MSSSILSWQILTAHAQPFTGTRYLAFCLKVPLDSLLVWASSGGPAGPAHPAPEPSHLAQAISTKFAWRGPYVKTEMFKFYNYSNFLGIRIFPAIRCRKSPHLLVVNVLNSFIIFWWFFHMNKERVWGRSPHWRFLRLDRWRWQGHWSGIIMTFKIDCMCKALQCLHPENVSCEF